jgi:hypothetical protein
MKEVKSLSREDWIILRLIRAGVKADRQLRFNPEFHRALSDLINRCGVRTVHEAIHQLNNKGGLVK